MYKKDLHEVEYKDGWKILELFLLRAIRLINGINQGSIISWKDVYKRLSFLHFCKKDSRTLINWMDDIGLVEIRGSRGLILTEKALHFLTACKLEKVRYVLKGHVDSEGYKDRGYK